MAETPLISLLPTTAVPTIGSSPNTQGAPNVPPAIANLPLGTIIKGFVLSRDQQGNPVLRTENGDLLIKSDYFLKIGSEVSVRVEALAGTLRARIISVDGIPPQLYAQQSQQPVLEDDNITILSNTFSPSSQTQTATAEQQSRLPQQPFPASAQRALETPTPNVPDKISLRAVLVAPAPNASTTLTSLPASIPIPREALAPGAEILVRIVTADIVATHTPQTTATTSSALVLPQQTEAQTAATATRIPAPPLPQSATTVTTTTSPLQPTLPAPQAPTNTQVANQSYQQPNVQPFVTSPSTPTPTAATSNITPQTVIPTTVAPATPPIPAPQTTTIAAQPPSTFPAQAPQPFAFPESAINTSLPPGAITGTVVGTEKSGDVVLHTPLGTLKLPPTVDLPSGARVTLELMALKNPAPIAAGPANMPLPPALSSVSEMSHQWAGLTTLMATLNGVDPQLAQQVMQNVIPQVGPKMAGSTMFFLFALRGGDLRQWLGTKAISALEQSGHGDVVKRVAGEFSLMRTAFLEQPSQNWQMWFIPMGHGEELHQARLFIKRDKEKEKQDSNKKAPDNTRFILEVELSELGNMQMDGLVRTKEEQTFFDLYIRSHQDLDKDMQRAIMEIFINSGKQTGFKGTVLFQATDEFPVKPLDEIMAEAAKPIIA